MGRVHRGNRRRVLREQVVQVHHSRGVERDAAADGGGAGDDAEVDREEEHSRRRRRVLEEEVVHHSRQREEEEVQPEDRIRRIHLEAWEEVRRNLVEAGKDFAART